MQLLLLRPKILAIKNNISRRKFLSTQTIRDLIIIALAIAIMSLLYHGSLWAITKINSNPNLLFLPAYYPLGMIFAVLFFMLVISATALAMGGFFLSDDLDLILASPISYTKFFFNKLVYITINSSWMPLIFIVPMLLGFGSAYKAPLLYYLIAPLILVPYFFLASSLSVVIAITLAKAVPPNRSREVLFVASIAFMGLLYLVIDLIRLSVASSFSASSLSQLVSFLGLANVSWLPSHWIALCLQDLMDNSLTRFSLYFPQLLSSTTFLIALAHILIVSLHFSCYTRAKSNKKRKSYNSQKTPSRIAALISQPQVAMISKELKTFSRDVTHTVQLLMLLGLCMVYILNLKVFSGLGMGGGDGHDDWYQRFFFLSNASVAAFVTTGFCTRFVFVSLSLEGRSLWLLQTAPIKIADIMKAKFRCWYPPVALLACLVFMAAGLSLRMGYTLIIISVLASWIIAYGIVGLAIGLGARFANFSWEHSSQLAAGFGNIVFMIASICLIGLNLIPACLMLFDNPFSLPYILEPGIGLPIFCVAMLLVMFSLNILTAKIAMDIGRDALESREVG
jgi:ABC-2 type transport system permease protein